MHHDKKVGLGLGILLVGIIGAFFFREEPRPLEPFPELQSAEMLDREISETLAGNPNPSSDLEEYEQRHKPAVNRQGVEITGLDESDSGVPSRTRKVFDEEFDFLNDPDESITDRPQVATNSEEPLPDDNRAERAPPSVENSKSGQDVDVTVSQSSTPRELPPAQAMFTEDLPASEESSTEPFASDETPATGETTRDSAESSEEETNDHRIYIVRKGDTLSGIASRELSGQIHYRKLFELNRDQLSSPNDLKPGMQLTIPQREQFFEPATEVSLAEPQESPSPDPAQQKPERETPQPSTRRDRRVIVPRRVRLNEPIANNPSPPPVDRPRARFTHEPSREETDDALPTLEGLEPLDVPH